MTEEKKQAYKLRITQANKTQLVTILYEMTNDYMSDAEKATVAGDLETADRENVHAQGCVDQLISGLDMQYEISRNLLQLYLYAKQELVRAIADRDPVHYANARIVTEGLHKTYLELEKMDDSQPEMTNAQSVVAGMTYGQAGLNETVADPASNRGFMA